MTIGLLLDTNYFLHFQYFAEVDWKRLEVAEGDDVVLIVCAVVIRELEEKKYDTRPKISQRARRAVRYLFEALDRMGGLPKIELIGEEPINIRSDRRLDPSLKDDVVIANAINLNDREEFRKVVVVSDDAGVLLKCRTFGIPFWRPNEDLRLPEPSDPVAKELARLKRENAELLAASPKPEFRLSKRCISGPLVSLRSSEENLFPESAEEHEVSYPPLTSGGVLAFGVPPEEVERYNEGLKLHHREYRRYLDDLREYRACLERTFEVEFEVRNQGGAPIEDLDVLVVFPEQVETVRRQVSDLVRPKQPDIPKRPRSSIEQFSMMALSDLGLSQHDVYSPDIWVPTLRPDVREAPNTTGPNIRENESEWHIKYLKHGKCITLPKLVVSMTSKMSQGLEVHYSLHAANTVSPVTGQLGLALDLGE